MFDAPRADVRDLIERAILLIEDGNHGEYRPRRSEFTSEGIAFIRAADLNGGRIDFDGAEKIDGVAYGRIRKGIGKPLDVILSHKGTVGKIAMAPADSPGYVCSPQTTFWRSLQPSILMPQFLLYFIQSAEFARQLVSRQSESDMAPYVSLTEQRKFWIRLPPPEFQRAVSRLLGALDGKIAVNERIATMSFDLAMAHYRKVASTEGSLQVTAVGEVAEVFDGPHATPKKIEKGPWFLSISSLDQGRLNLDESAHVSGEDFVKWTRRVAPRPGDLLFSYETRLGEAALMPGGVRACLGRRMALMRPRAGVAPTTLLFAYLADEFQETIRQRAVHGATVDRIPLVDLPSWPIKLPDPQTRRRVGDLFGALHRRAEQTMHENRALAELRDTLLPKLMSGELRIKLAERMVRKKSSDGS